MIHIKINEFVQICHGNAVNKGFWDKPREIGTMIALIHSEVTEALFADSCAEFCEELADICIRIGDLCGGLKIDLELVLSCLEEDIPLNINTDSFEELEDSLSALEIDLDDCKHACGVHCYLSQALEADRESNKSLFSICMGWAFYHTLTWAAHKGHRIYDVVIQKMEKNKQRPRLHGKQY